MALPALALLAAGGCELQEIALAVPDDVIVAEVVLRAGEPVQRALLHRTGGGSSRVLGARVEVRERDTDRVVLYNVVQDSVCTGMSGPSAAGTCYGATTGVDGIRPGMQYDLRIDVEDRTLRGTTTVPGVFSVNRPGAPVVRAGAAAHDRNGMDAVGGGVGVRDRGAVSEPEAGAAPGWH